MKMFDTLRIVPTGKGYLVIKEQVAEVWLEPTDEICYIERYDMTYKLRELLDTKPEEDNNATE